MDPADVKDATSMTSGMGTPMSGLMGDPMTPACASKGRTVKLVGGRGGVAHLLLDIDPADVMDWDISDIWNGAPMSGLMGDPMTPGCASKGKTVKLAGAGAGLQYF